MSTTEPTDWDAPKIRPSFDTASLPLPIREIATREVRVELRRSGVSQQAWEFCISDMSATVHAGNIVYPNRSHVASGHPNVTSSNPDGDQDGYFFHAEKCDLIHLLEGVHFYATKYGVAARILLPMVDQF